MEIPLFQVDAFAERPFEGNPAAVCLLQRWLPDATMQSIAAENALSETAFVLTTRHPFELRWFTPGAEVELCGHATLASAFIVMDEQTEGDDDVVFASASGLLPVRRRGPDLTLDFPSRPVVAADLDPELDITLAGPDGPRAVARLHNQRSEFVVYDSQADLAALAPDFRALLRRDRPYVIATAPGDEHDFVSRFFAPGVGVDEDPVTGSAHTSLAPYWAARLGRTQLRARQISKRGGELRCEVVGERVLITGRCVTFSRGQCIVPD